MTHDDPAVLMRDALIELRRLQARVTELETERREPIAVVGMGCRFAGVASPDELWAALAAGVDAVREVPASRWDAEALFDADPDAAGRIYCRTGSFVDAIDAFDAAFFGIAPREAAMLDPQQRMLLEVAWEAIERAGITAEALRGSAAGTFVGVMHQDYAHRIRSVRDVDLYTASGNAASVLAGRLSHFLGGHGPAVTIDTACSSSLVAVHLACRALRARECDLAVAGGVNVVLSPLATAAECRARMLSPTGRCRPFDDAADGFVRGEGCGVVVLQRLSDALAAGRPIEAVILGSAVNHDGRSAGLTVPNGAAQEQLLRAALADARTDPAELSFVETHGTGTALGDPIEAMALAAVFAEAPRPSPLLIGSVKSNFGHLEGAAGIAGLIKAVLAVGRGVVPPTLHVRRPNRAIDWTSVPLRLALAAEPLPARRRVGGVSSFGFSGTNAHAVVASAPEVEPAHAPNPPGGRALVTISAKSAASLRANAARYAARLRAPDAPSLDDFAHSSRVARSHFAHRAAVIAASARELADLLDAFAGGDDAAVLHGVAVRPDVYVDDAGDGGLETLADRYVRGANIDWSAAMPANGARVVPLPVYAFDRQRYWLRERDESSDSPLYRVAWIAVAPSAAGPRSGLRVIAGADPRACRELASRMEQRGERCVIAGADAAAIVGAANGAVAGVVLLDGADGDGRDDALACVTRRAMRIVRLARELAERPSFGPVSLVTQHGVAAGPADAIDPIAAAVRAVARVARVEQGAAWGCAIDVDGSPASLDTAAAILASHADEEEVAVRGSVVLTPRLRRIAGAAAMPALDGEAAYLVTGGTGEVGLAAASWLADRGARHVILTSRNGGSGDRVRLAVAAMRKRGVDVRVEAADVCDAAAMRALFESRRVRGVIHAAGVLADAGIASVTGEDFAAVARSKVGGAEVLDALLREHPPDFFVLVSSISAVLGRHGQASYAAANAYLDALAHRRRLEALPALSIGWGPWSVGMAARDARTAERVRTGGLVTMAPAEALHALEQAFGGDAHALAAVVDWDRVAAEPRLPRMVDGLVPRVPAARASRVFDIASLAGRSIDARKQLLLEHLEGQLRDVLRSEAPLPADVSLLDLGVDSLTASELRNAVEVSTGVAIPIRLLVDGSPLRAVAGALLDRLAWRQVAAAEPPSAEPPEVLTL